jgi:uncharacterized protein (UPF0548 family)
MFVIRRPSLENIDRFLRESEDLPLSYGQAGILTGGNASGVHEFTSVIGHGEADFARAQAALMAWQHFDIGWVQTFPRRAPIAAGTIVAVLIRHIGFWSLNGCRVLSATGAVEGSSRCGFAYGTLTNHSESGEELFEVFLHPETNQVIYRIQAVSRPQATLALIGSPIVRRLQQRFRDDSAAALRRLTART